MAMEHNNNVSLSTGMTGEQIIRWLCFAGVVALAFLIGFHTLTGVDIFWHLKAGEIICKTHQVPGEDIFSFTREGSEWINAQWLFQVVIYTLYRVSGYTGMILFSAVLAALAWSLILAVAYQPKKYLLTTIIALIALLAASSRLKLRPESFSLLFIALEIFLVTRFLKGRKLYLYPVPILLLVWVNCEGLWPIGYLILLAFLIEEIFFLPQLKMNKYFTRVMPAPREGAALRLALCFVFSLFLSLVNPYGLRGVTFPWKLFRQISFPGSFIGQYIGEFQNPFQHLPWLELSAYMILIVLSALVLLIRLSRRQLSPATIILWIGFLYISMVSLRNVAMFAVAAAALVGWADSEEKGGGFFRQDRFKNLVAKARPFLAAGIIVIMIPIGVDIISSRFFIRNKSYVRFGVGALETEFPVRACKFLKDISFPPEPLASAKIFNDLDSAGYLIWSGYPEWKVFTDPRLEVYGEEFFERYSSLFLDYREFKKEDIRYHLDAVVLSPLFKNKFFVRELYYDPEWVLVYLDGLNVVFLKVKPAFSALIREHAIDLDKALACPPPAGFDGEWLARERLGRGSMLVLLGKSELALQELEDAVRLDPEDPNINFYTGWALRNLRHYREARPYLEKTAKSHPEFMPNRIQLAEVYALLGDTDTAIIEFQQILSKNPDELMACIDLAKVYEKVEGDRAYPTWQMCSEIYYRNPQRFAPFKTEISQALERLK